MTPDQIRAALRQVIDAAYDLRIDANRLCDRNNGGTYEDDCRRSIARLDLALSHGDALLAALPVKAPTTCATCRHCAPHSYCERLRFYIRPDVQPFHCSLHTPAPPTEDR